MTFGRIGAAGVLLTLMVAACGGVVDRGDPARGGPIAAAGSGGTTSSSSGGATPTEAGAVGSGGSTSYGDGGGCGSGNAPAFGGNAGVAGAAGAVAGGAPGTEAGAGGNPDAGTGAPGCPPTPPAEGDACVPGPYGAYYCYYFASSNACAVGWKCADVEPWQFIGGFENCNAASSAKACDHGLSCDFVEPSASCVVACDRQCTCNQTTQLLECSPLSC